MIKNWSVTEIKQEIRKISYAESDPRTTGFVTWGYKQDLYEILWFVEDQLRSCSTYADEEEFLKEHQKQETWKALNEVHR